MIILSVVYFMLDLIVELNSSSWNLQAEGDRYRYVNVFKKFQHFSQERCKTSLNVICQIYTKEAEVDQLIQNV